MTDSLFVSTSLCLRIVALTIIFAMLVPAVFIGEIGPVKVSAASNLPAPVSAPPEPFLVQGSKFKVQGLLALGVHSLLNYALADTRASAPEPQLSYALADTRASAPEPQSVSRSSPLLTLNSPLVMPPPAGSVRFDFDGDGKADIGRWHATTTEFKVKNSGNGSFTTTIPIGTTSGKSCPADFDGDGKTDPAVFSAGTWKIKKSSNGQIQTITGFGLAGDIPLPGNYRGTTVIDAAVFRPSNNTWYFRDGASGAITSQVWGAAGDIPVPGNYNGDTLTDVAVYRPATGVWHIVLNGGGNLTYTWGTGSDIPVPADYDADNKTDVAVYRRTSGTWYVIGSLAGQFSQIWGNYGDQPTPADYDGDNKADFSIWRPSTGKWYTINSSHPTNQQVPQFSYDTLGVAGDTAVPSSYVKQIGGTVSPYQLAQDRLSPRNATGGTDLYSRNFSWGTSLVGLPGRAGMNAGFGLSYNSLVWTKSGSEIYFDTDAGNVSPGFRIGFPTIEPAYYDSVKGAFAYLMVTPSGGRVEFRQVAATGIYETVDSSYAQLKTVGAATPNDPVENITITVISTDGTQMKYLWKGGAFRCTEVKDRNGNYITLVHDDYGLLQTMTDTLGRVVTVVYDAGLYPVTVKQTWQSGDHNYATFAYTNVTINTNFTTPITSVIGPPNGTVIKVLEKITHADGSYTKFTYNSYGQVWKVQNYAADNHELNYVRTNLETISGVQTDCPRLGQTISKVENFNGGNEITVTNTQTPNQPYSVGGLTGTGTRIDVTMSNHPDGLYSRTFVGETGWKEGLPLATEDCIGANCADRKRWTWTDYTQDNIALTYIANPRVKEARVGDSTNVKKTAVEYHLVGGSTTVALYGLVKKVEVFDTGLSNVIKRVETDYLLTKPYTDRNIVGLPSETRAWGKNDTTQNLEPTSRVTYGYDEGTFSQEPNQIIAPTRHDTANYGPAFTKRGNPTSTTRWEVPNNVSSVTSQVKYDIAGSPVAQIDPLNRKVRIGYADNFQPTGNPATFAYPTVITDPAGTSLGDSLHSSTVKYRYDIGANVEAASPAPAGNTLGKKTARVFDSVGRLQQETIVNSGAYTRYEYPTNGIQSKVFSTIIDTNNNGADTLDEVMSESWSDGAGRVRRSRTPHTFDSGGNALTWAGSIVEYDILGRAKRQSVPTEISVPDANNPDTWSPAGDDTAFLWTYQKYDWKGRVTRKINTDGTDSPTLNDSDVLIGYEGCGCAGGQQTTIETERVPVPGTSNFARRKQKAYEDILGRAYKTETFEWDGTTVYSTNVQNFNGRDQVTQSRQFAGTTSSTTYQDTTATFDGHGRLKTSHKPEQQNPPGTPAFTTYNYNTDDSISTVVDARGAATNYTYNPTTGMRSQISWSVPQGSNIEVTPSVLFTYDNVGNRLTMVDGLGTVNYQYNELSQMSTETRIFNDTLPDKPAGNFNIGYEYTLGGQLKSYTDPWGKQIAYTQDRTGRLTSVTGTSFGGVTNYADTPGYRAWGALKHLEYGNDFQMDATYNTRLQASTFKVFKPGDTTYTPFDQSYEYFKDGKLKLMDRANDGTQQRFDRSFTYDHTGQVKDANSGIEAHGQTQTNLLHMPYRQSYTHNSFGNLTGRESTLWNYSNGDWDFAYAVTNNRVSGYGYDADGRQISGDDDTSFKYDASGLMIESSRTENNETALRRDGSGREGVRSQRTWNVTSTSWNAWEARYFIRSSVLGRNVSEAGTTGKKKRTYVIAAGAVIARQAVDDTNQESVGWEHRDPSGLSARSTAVSGGSAGEATVTEEFDALGNNVGLLGDFTRPPAPYTNSPSGADHQIFNDMSLGDCELDGILTPCSMVERIGGEALQLQARYWNSREGFTYQYFNFNTDLPGRSLSMSVYIPGHSFETPNGGGSGSDDDPIQVGSTGEFPGQWFTFASWDLRVQTHEAPVDGPDYGKLQAAINLCAESMFGVTLNGGGQWSGQGQDGEMKFQVMPGTTVWNYANGLIVGYGSKATTFSIYNDTTSYALNSKEMTGGMGFASKPDSGTPGIYIVNNTTNGVTSRTNRTFTASDRERAQSDGQTYYGQGLGISGFIHTQIHEAGNALSYITGKPAAAPLTAINPQTGKEERLGHQDSGLAFEICVLNGYRKSLPGN